MLAPFAWYALRGVFALLSALRQPMFSRPLGEQERADEGGNEHHDNEDGPGQGDAPTRRELIHVSLARAGHEGPAMAQMYASLA
jgi:hypothetical protein